MVHPPSFAGQGSKLTKRTRSRLIAFLFAGLLAVGGALWWNRPSPNLADAAAPSTVEATHREFSSSVRAIGAIKPKIGAEVRVGSRISGRLEGLPANIGDKVEIGQVLAELESADLRAIVARNQAAAAVAKEKIVDAEARAKLSDTVYQRRQGLKTTGGTSQQLIDEALREHQGSVSGVEIAKMELELAQAQVRESQVTLSYATIRAPISGIVASVTTQQGETVAAGLTAPTFLTIVDLERLQVNALVDEVDIGKVQVGQRVVFNVDAFPAQDFTGQVAAIYPTATIVDNVVKYITAIDINETQRGLLRPEMTANLQIMLETRTVLSIPTRAIRQENGRSVVYVSKGLETEVRPVRVGWRDGSWAEVVEGVVAGERILLNASPTSGGKPR
jgi:macrolide-specific efflux system membrane fusion protein